MDRPDTEDAPQATRESLQQLIATGDADQAAAAMFDLGALERTEGRADAARAAFEQAAATGHQDIAPMALANLAVLEATEGRAAQARALFEQAIATGHPDHAPQSLFNFGAFEQRHGSTERARELYQRAVASGHGTHARKARFNLANLEAGEGRLAEACDLYLQAMEPPFYGDTAWRAHRRLREIDPSRLADAREVYLRAMAEQDETTAAHARELLLDLDPRHVGPGNTITIGAHRFDLDDIESAEWLMPKYGSGHVEIRTRDGQEVTIFTDLRDRRDYQAYLVLNERFGGGPG